MFKPNDQSDSYIDKHITNIYMTFFGLEVQHLSMNLKSKLARVMMTNIAWHVRGTQVPFLEELKGK